MKTGTVFAVLFAICFELSRRWPSLLFVFPIFASVGIISSVALIRGRKFEPNTVGAIGAGCLLFCLLWGVGISAHDRSLYSPDGRKIRFGEPNFTVAARGANDGFFELTFSYENFLEVKEIFYRLSPDMQYKSTGFIELTNDGKTRRAANSYAQVNCLGEIIEGDVKYIGSDGAEYGPYNFSFKKKDLIMKMWKNIIGWSVDWVLFENDKILRSGDKLYSLDGVDIGKLKLNDDMEIIDIGKLNLNYNLHSVPDDIIEKIMYGINKDIPDSDFGFIAKNEKTFEKNVNGPINYVSSQIFFKDGTSSDIGIYR